MHELPSEWLALCVAVTLLGARHGLDADHLAAIDGLTRHNRARNRAFARYCGALFSLGHGIVVIAIAIAVAAARTRWTPPGWLDLTGAWISIGFLSALGFANLFAVVRAAPGEPVAPVAMKTALLRPLQRAGRPYSVALVGALFAISFDTVSQAALFGFAATQFGGVQHGIVLGLLFTAGMAATDAANGLWISRLLARADTRVARASRVLGLAIAGVSLMVAGVGAAKLLSADFEQWSADKGTVLGVAVLVVVLGAFLAGTLRQPDVGKVVSE